MALSFLFSFSFSFSSPCASHTANQRRGGHIPPAPGLRGTLCVGGRRLREPGGTLSTNRRICRRQCHILPKCRHVSERVPQPCVGGGCEKVREKHKFPRRQLSPPAEQQTSFCIVSYNNPAMSTRAVLHPSFPYNTPRGMTPRPPPPPSAESPGTASNTARPLFVAPLLPPHPNIAPRPSAPARTPTPPPTTTHRPSTRALLFTRPPPPWTTTSPRRP